MCVRLETLRRRVELCNALQRTLGTVSGTDTTYVPAPDHVPAYVTETVAVPGSRRHPHRSPRSAATCGWRRARLRRRAVASSSGMRTGDIPGRWPTSSPRMVSHPRMALGPGRWPWDRTRGKNTWRPSHDDTRTLHGLADLAGAGATQSMREPHRMQWTSAARRRCAPRGFHRDIVERLLRTSTER